MCTTENHRSGFFGNFFQFWTVSASSFNWRHAWPPAQDTWEAHGSPRYMSNCVLVTTTVSPRNLSTQASASRSSSHKQVAVKTSKALSNSVSVQTRLHLRLAGCKRQRQRGTLASISRRESGYFGLCVERVSKKSTALECIDNVEWGAVALSSVFFWLAVVFNAVPEYSLFSWRFSVHFLKCPSSVWCRLVLGPHVRAVICICTCHVCKISLRHTCFDVQSLID